MIILVGREHGWEGASLIPKRIYPYFAEIKNSDTITEGRMICCNHQDFDVYTCGEIKKSYLKLHTYLTGDAVALKIKCNKCGGSILVFDSKCDGYDMVCENVVSDMDGDKLNFVQFRCKKCSSASFGIGIKLEYAGTDEIATGDAFTWICVTLECNQCHARYKNFIDYEAG